MTGDLPGFLTEFMSTLIVGGPLILLLYHWLDTWSRKGWAKRFGEPMPEQSLLDILQGSTSVWCVALAVALLSKRFLHDNPVHIIIGSTVCFSVFVTYHTIWRAGAQRRS